MMQRTGTLKVNSAASREVNIRWHANGELKATKLPGTMVIMLAETAPGQDGFKWFKVSYGPNPDDIGWVREDVIDVQQSAPSPSPSPSPPVSDIDTQLLFETNTRVVRVFMDRGQLLINVYHKASNKNELSAVPATCMPAVDSQAPPWKSYMARQDDKVYLVRFIPRAQTELMIGNAMDGSVLEQESGFGSKGTAYTKL
ncbi:MAG: hypothetical protein F6K19_03005 [Cyanothece sp. SIO1E1]|nr:hypothetical protein [Cyanothece sp. SIO1E1]